MWVRFKRSAGKRARWDKERWLSIEPDKLVEVRARVREYCEEKYPAGEGMPLGFVPRTIAASVARDMGFRTQGADWLLLSYAFYLPIQTTGGTWQEGPTGQWKTLPRVFNFDGN